MVCSVLLFTLLPCADDGPSELLADASRLVSECDTLYDLLVDEPSSDARIQQFVSTVPRAEAKVRVLHSHVLSFATRKHSPAEALHGIAPIVSLLSWLVVRWLVGWCCWLVGVVVLLHNTREMSLGYNNTPLLQVLVWLLSTARG